MVLLWSHSGATVPGQWQPGSVDCCTQPTHVTCDPLAHVARAVYFATSLRCWYVGWHWDDKIFFEALVCQWGLVSKCYVFFTQFSLLLYQKLNIVTSLNLNMLMLGLARHNLLLRRTQFSVEQKRIDASIWRNDNMNLKYFGGDKSRWRLMMVILADVDVLPSEE